jgi:hypothetical protein
MKSHSLFPVLLGGLLLTPVLGPILAAESSTPFVYETPDEFFANGDFDGDGRLDVVIVDKETGKYRIGYQLPDGQLNWVDCRPSGIRNTTGFTIGKLLSPDHLAFAFTDPNDNQISIADASNPNVPPRPVMVPFSAGLGPNVLTAIRIGSGSGKDDLFVGSIYNSPEPNELMLLHSEGTEFSKSAEEQLPGPAAKANRFSVKAGGAELACELVAGDNGNTFRIEDLSTGKPVVVASAGELPAGSDYAIGNFGGKSAEVIFYKPGENNLKVSAIEQSGGKYQLGKENIFDLKEPIQSVIALATPRAQKLFVIIGKG